ncbi:MAG TPA: hypothetical protein PLV68_14070 [Ilumatobacteraceae bacterium]|nr:hypothetical protein [Ilumatobacteraceae bacterium]
MSRPNHADDWSADPFLIPHRGRLAWLWPSGRITPDVSGGEGEGDADKKFTQADVDRIIQQRLDQWQRNNPPAPPADYQQIKDELATLKAAAGTDLDRANTRIAALEQQLSGVQADLVKANGERDDAKLNLLGAAMKSAVTTAARAAANPDQVYALLPKDALTIGDDGQVKGAEEAVKKFLADNPHFVGKTGPRPDKGQGATGAPPSGREAGLAEAQRRGWIKSETN